MKKRFTILAALLSAALLCACGNTASENNANNSADTESSVEVSTETPIEEDTSAVDVEAIKANATLFVDFANGASDAFEPSDGWSNGDMFYCTWRKANCKFTEDGKMQLVINRDLGLPPYSGAEYRSKDFYGYGRYEVSLKAIKNDGVVTSFFTYTGPSDNNPWDEIDIEILGKDTTKVQFNYFTNGAGNHEYMHDLGFDASEDFHTYAFEWHKDKIVWFVDGVEIHTATLKIPTTDSKIMMNVWPGKGVDGWLKAFDDTNLPLTAEYEWLAYTAFEE